MLLKQTPPELVLFQPNKSTPISQVVAPLHMNTTYRFGTASEMEFKVQKYLYDEASNSWYKNPSYDDMVSNNLIYSSEDSDLYRFKGCSLLDNASYGAAGWQGRSRDSSRTGLFFLADMAGCELQDEYAVYNLGRPYGYNWKLGTYIDDNGGIVTDPERYGSYEAIEEFFPVEVGDIISLGSRPNNGLFERDATALFGYRIHYYTDAEPTTQTKKSEWMVFNPVGRIAVSDGDFDYNTHVGLGNVTTRNYVKSGYIRIELQCLTPTLIYPVEWCVIITSGERRCTKVNVVTNPDGSDAYFDRSLKMQWWVIKDVQEEIDGYNSTKTITAYSYEYTISNKTFSIEECTLPLFIPDKIPKTVSSNRFCIDSCDHIDYHGSQRMERGLINRILDICPQWSVGYVSPELLTRYRSIPDCDEVNIYSFLLNTVQELYRCFLIFDSERMQINLIDMDGVMSVDSNAIISWRNALKLLSITNSDTNYATALRVHTSDDKYGIGMANPNGTNVIYNFDAIADKLDYVADDQHMNDNDPPRPYTLLERWNAYKAAVVGIQNGSVKINGTKTISQIRKTVIDGMFEITEIERKLSEALSAYQQIADKINILLDYEDEGRYKRLSDVPISSFNNDNAPVNFYSNYASETLYNQLVRASQLYYEVRSTYNLKKIEIEGAIADLKDFSKMLSISPSVLQPIYDAIFEGGESSGGAYYPIFTPKEAKELSKYIIEGTWTNDNIIFNEGYNAADIINTLMDVYNTARLEFNDIYSKPAYDFSATIAGVFATDEGRNMFSELALGNSLYIIDDSTRKQFDYIKPVLLSVHVDYDNWSDSSFELSTDYRRKPLEIRFTDLFGMVSQTDASNLSYTYKD